MKRAYKILVLCAIVFTLILAFSSCEHEHIPTAWVKENVIEATCTTDGSYDTVMYCKDCDYEFLRQTQTIPMTEHSVKDGACQTCGIKESSAGLKFSLNSDGKSYTVIDIGECTDSEIVIGIYNGLYVTHIGDYAFEGCSNITKITISRSVSSIGLNAFGMCQALVEVFFENPSDWRYVSYFNPQLRDDFSSTELSDTAVAARYLVSDYNGCYWKKG